MVAFFAKVDGTWQAKFQRRLRHRVTGLRPSGLPNLPFSLVLSFPPFSSASPPFSLFLQCFLFSPFFPLPFSFFTFFPQFSSNFPSPPLTSRFFQRFLVKATRLHVTPLSAMCTTRHGILKRTRHVVEEDVCIFLSILKHLPNKQVRKVFRVHVIRTLSFFREKVMFLK